MTAYQLPRCLKPVAEVDQVEAAKRGWPTIFNGRYVDTSGMVTNTKPTDISMLPDHVELDLPAGWTVEKALAQGWQAVLMPTGPGPMGIGGPNVDYWVWRTPKQWVEGFEHAGEPGWYKYFPERGKPYWTQLSKFGAFPMNQ